LSRRAAVWAMKMGECGSARDQFEPASAGR
jgi:hypothetical protein